MIGTLLSDDLAFTLSDSPELIPLPRGSGRSDPASAFHKAIAEALARPPCFVLFSGGVDSSFVLAVATSIARSEGLPEPIALTRRYPELAAADESTFQEALIAHLGLADWQRFDVADEYDLLGPMARGLLEARGRYLPVGLGAAASFFERTRNATVLTGEMGDDVLGVRRGAAVGFVPRAIKRHPSRAVTHVRRAHAILRPAARQLTDTYPWLSPEGVRAATTFMSPRAGREPLAIDRALEYCARRRVVVEGLATLCELASTYDVDLRHPLADPSFVDALGTLPRSAFLGRSALIERLWPGLLPQSILTRRTKASFNGAFFGPLSRRFVEEWESSTYANPYVDKDRLRDEWRSDDPSAMSFHLLQDAWLQQRAFVA